MCWSSSFFSSIFLRSSYKTQVNDHAVTASGNWLDTGDLASGVQAVFCYSTHHKHGVAKACDIHVQGVEVSQYSGILVLILFTDSVSRWNSSQPFSS